MPKKEWHSFQGKVSSLDWQINNKYQGKSLNYSSTYKLYWHYYKEHQNTIGKIH